uniref:UDP-N-acetylglucosamine--peptide N-acetylglucosaminyltransferase 110 kDa subunit (Trinotate prediction) n=1 Tax=Myxobolus squamalis TaxID=59785 RepID=A0A6B2G309_MYXSQ
MISDHGIQILLNLNGYTKGARNEIFALKPAPIQIMYLGYPSTSGSNYMDYIITDKVTSPMEHEEHYSEKFAYMPNSFFIGDHARMFPHVLRDLTSHCSITSIVSGCNQKSPIFSQHCNDISNLSYIRDRKTLNQYVDFHLKQRNEENLKCKNSGERIPEMNEWILDRKFLGILKDNFVFCNFNQLYKLDPNTFSCWCRILNRVPNSVLWLLKFPKFGESNLREYAKKHGVPQSKIIFTDVAGKEEHVRRGQIADICLDTPICNGHTTGMDVLWAGCPIVTMPLNSFASRVGSSIMTAIGCKELVVNNFKEYEEISVKLAIDKEYYKKIKSKIWFNRVSSSLFNVNKYTSDFDSLLYKIWDSYTKNNKIIHILDSSPLLDSS